MKVFIFTLSYINFLSRPTAGKDCIGFSENKKCDNMMKYTSRICIYQENDWSFTVVLLQLQTEIVKLSECSLHLNKLHSHFLLKQF